MKRLLSSALVAMSVLILMSCGGGGDDSPATGTATGSSPSAATSTPTDPGSGTPSGTGSAPPTSVDNTTTTPASTPTSGTASQGGGVTQVQPTAPTVPTAVTQTVTVPTNLINVTNIDINIDALASAIAQDLTPITVYPPAPSATTPPASSDGPVETPIAQARFNFPRAVAMSIRGNLHVADSGNRTVRRITRAGIITTIAGLTGQDGETDGKGSAARFNYLTAIAVDVSENVYVVDNNAIRKVAPDGTVTTLAGAVMQSGNVDGSGAQARFFGPQAIAVGNDGTVYVADTGNNAVRAVSATGVVTTLSNRITGPRAMAISENNLFVADDYRIWRIGLSGTPISASLLVGDPSPTPTFSNVDGTGATARFWRINGLTLNPNGSLFVVTSAIFPKASGGVALIRRVTPDALQIAWTVTTVAGTTGIGYADGAGDTVRFNAPVGITSDIEGSMFIADAANQVLRRMTTDGTVTTTAGRPGERGSNY